MKTLAAALLALATVAAVAPAHAGFGPNDVRSFEGPGFGPNDLSTQTGPAFGPQDVRSFEGPAFGPADVRSFEGPARWFQAESLGDRK